MHSECTANKTTTLIHAWMARWHLIALNILDLDEETTWVFKCTIENALIMISMTAKFNPFKINQVLAVTIHVAMPQT